jgi:hypothetical protein
MTEPTNGAGARLTVALLRVSSEQQDVASQRTSIEAYAAAREWTVDQWIEEPAGTHGDSPDRPMLDALLARCAAGEVGRLLVTMQDRVGRRGWKTASIMNELHEYGVEVHATLDGGKVEMSEDSWGDVIVYLKAKAARQFLVELRKKTAAGLDGWALEVGGRMVRVPKGTPCAVRVAVKSGKKVGRPAGRLAPEVVAEAIRRHRAGESFAAIAATIRGTIQHRPQAEDGTLGEPVEREWIPTDDTLRAICRGIGYSGRRRRRRAKDVAAV